MPVLVTGGAGFIGSNLVDALLDAGHDVTVVDDLTTGRKDNLEGALRRGATLERADVTAPGAVAEVVARVRPEAVYHLAAQIDVRRSLEDPAADAAVNVGGTIAVLDAAARHGVPRVVNVSTGGAIYGDSGELPTPETTPAAPLAAYGVSKLAAETYCAWFSRHHNLVTVTLRLANVYGPRQDPLGEAGVVAIFCDRVRQGLPATIYGDGRQSRDFVFVGDVADALRQAAEVDVGRSALVNVGSGRETTVLDLAELVGRAAGRPLPIVHEAARTGEVTRSLLDDRRGRDLLRRDEPTDLVTGLRRTLAWLDGRTAQAAVPPASSAG